VAHYHVTTFVGTLQINDVAAVTLVRCGGHGNTTQAGMYSTVYTQVAPRERTRPVKVWSAIANTRLLGRYGSRGA
jgi:hypothetical protein